MKRLFIAIDLPEEIKKELQNVCNFFIERNLFSGKCVGIANMHITLHFIGFATDDCVRKISKALSNVYVRKCKARLTVLDVLPTRRVSRIIFASLDAFCISILVKEIKQLFLRQDLPWIENTRRPYRNHITLARIKKIEHKEDFLYALDNVGLKPLEFDIQEFKLKESVLTPDGPIYTTIGSYNLFNDSC
jgi:2'-5' RNA ligase